MTAPVIVGRTVTLTENQYAYEELRPRTEELAREQLRLDGVEPTFEQWVYEPESSWFDEETGETLQLPAMWMFMCEGVRDG